MRLLFTIPHYFKSSPQASHGSLKANEAVRAACVTECLASIHRCFGSTQALLNRTFTEANQCKSSTVSIVVCTFENDHLLAKVPSDLYENHPTTGDPRYLGYSCHEVLRDRLGEYDYYCFCEDDMQFNDALFFAKLKWFHSFAGFERLLQPNRYEYSAKFPKEKLYIDGPLARPQFGEDRRIASRPTLVASHLGTDVVFQQVNNPHAGCFFLTEQQMRHWTQQPYFLDRSQKFVGPLESAATLGIMRTFETYKPARENASFLELRHLDNRYLGNRASIEANFRSP